MSFILDALRKSELERQRDAAGRIMRLPVAQHAGVHMPVWATALIVVLAISVAVLAGTVWHGRHGHASATTGAAAAVSRAAAPQTAAPAAEPRRAAGARASADRRPSARTAAQGSRKAPTVSATRGSAAAKRAKRARRPPPAPPANPAALPSVEELTADGVQIPAVTLQLHVYSKNPKRRFVFIDGTRYQEGQKTEEGPVLVSITPKGAVLSQHGREFFVPTQ